MTDGRPVDARSTCANCEAPLDGPYCAACGQKDLGTRVTILELMREVVSETFEVEGRLPRTLWSLATRPGHYLGEFLDGRRRSFASPLRFYLFMLFFTAVVLGWRGRDLAKAASGLNLGLDSTELHMSSSGVLGAPRVEFPTLYVPLSTRAGCRADLDLDPWLPMCAQPVPIEWLASLPPEASMESQPRPTGTTGALFELVAFLMKQSPDRVVTLVVGASLQQIPLLMTLLLVVYAGILKVLWPRTPTTVHVITSMVFHTLAMVALTLVALLPWKSVALVLLVWLQLHLVCGLRRAFKAGWPRAVVSYGLSSVLWGGACLLGAGLATWFALQELVTLYVPL